MKRGINKMKDIRPVFFAGIRRFAYRTPGEKCGLGRKNGKKKYMQMV
jgi:hypothetical protein